MKTSELAHGNWFHILTNFGISESFLKGKHTACPLCGGTDRFRYDDYKGNGNYFCSGCGPNAGFNLLMKFKDWTYAEAAREIDYYLGKDAIERPIPKKKIDYDDRKVAIEKILKRSKKAEAGDAVYEYLNNRGLDHVPSAIGYCSNLFHVEAKKKYEGMVCRIVDVNGLTVSLHRTFLKDGKKAPVNNPRKILAPIGTIKGCAIRLFKVKDELLGIAEGIESSLAVQRLFNIPCWAAMNAGNLETFEPPEDVRGIIIYGDNDKNNRGQQAANILSGRLVKKGLEVDIMIPDTEGNDWLDELNNIS